MATQVWPVSLPQRPLIRKLQEVAPELRLRTNMDAGPAKMRRRFQAGVRPFVVSMVLTGAQVETLDAFFGTTLQGGTLRFDFTHPRTGVTGEFRFVEPPQYSGVSPGTYEASMQLELMP